MGWLKEEGFGGIMIWSVDMDDFRGSCGTGKYPLLNAMHKELEDYRVALEYEGPYESSNPGSKGYTTKDREYLPIKNALYNFAQYFANLSVFSTFYCLANFILTQKIFLLVFL